MDDGYRVDGSDISDHNTDTDQYDDTSTNHIRGEV